MLLYRVSVPEDRSAVTDLIGLAIKPRGGSGLKPRKVYASEP
jgi:hypothetical protein